MRYVVLGTAGHIDHGKSALVKALTGIDPDRLKEEKERGITIDLGFADLEYPDGLKVGIVDVPGHERLVRNMLAGAGGIDIVLLVIAADEGIMPQTREHLQICSLLKIKSGIIALTKADLVEKDWLDLMKDDVRGFVKGSFLEGAQIIPVSSKTGLGIDALKEAIRESALKVKAKSAGGLFRLPIDRVFTLKGFGTVVTGTAVSGTISVNDTIEILPKGLTCGVRALHSHGKPIEKAYAGQRVAVNLQGVEKDDINRGDTIVTPERFKPSVVLDAKLELLPDSPKVKSREVFHFHAGTSETIARCILYGPQELKPGESSYCQMRLQEPVVIQAGDRFIVRRFSPVVTIGGGIVLDPSPPKRKRKEGFDELKVYETGTLDAKIAAKIGKNGLFGMPLRAIEGWIDPGDGSISDALKSLKDRGEILNIDDFYLHKSAFEAFMRTISGMIEAFHKKNPLKPGMPKEEARNAFRVQSKFFDILLSKVAEIVSEKDVLRLKGFKTSISSSEADEISQILEKSSFQPPFKAELAQTLQMPETRISDILKLMQKEGKISRINDSLYMSKSAHDRMMGLIREFFANKSEMSVSEFRDMLGTSRKYAVPFLEYLDSSRITLRVGDVRKLLGK
ncbi:MAG: selenocysteine-specific translation elongation factor [Nitrospirae bacterium]|nr:selenocysteine-specific translation elongation factor [Nitrospirota bacterium]